MNPFYVILDPTTNTYTRWEGKIIVFDFVDQVKKFQNLFPVFFLDIEKDDIIISMPDNIDAEECIHITDIPADELAKESEDKNDLLIEEQAARERINLKQKIITMLNTTLSADKMSNFTPDELSALLVDENIIASATDVNCLVIEAIQRALNDDDEFPIHFYHKNEPMREEGRNVDGVECLTDDYIATNLVNE